MAEFKVKDYNTLVSDMAAWVVAHSPQISDLNAGSVLRSIIEGLALGLEEVYVSGYLGFQRELAIMPQTIFSFAKKSGTTATTTVVFSGPLAPVGGITIAAGTHVKTASGLVFTTDTVATIAAGQTTSNAVAVTAEAVGTAYNVGAGEISIVADATIGVNSVTNANAAAQGTNDESDYAWQQRFQIYMEGLGRANIAGVMYGALSYPGITSVSYKELIPPESGVDARLYIDNGTQSGVTDAVIEAVQNIIDGDGTQAVPGYRAMGINTVVTAPAIVTQNITATIWLSSSAVAATVLSDINTALTAYVNTLGIGKALIKAKLEAIIMSVYGVTDCNVTLPTGNVAASPSQVIRAGTITILIG